MQEEKIFQLALSMIPEIGAIQAKKLLSVFGTASAIFQARKKELSLIDGIGDRRAKLIRDFNAFNSVEKEYQYHQKNKNAIIFQTDDAYPKRLLNCYDAPIILYYNGHCNLNSEKIISIVGTRNNTAYGKEIVENFIASLPLNNIVIVSGLAYGIDAIAHQSAIKNNIPTIGVLGHGLDRIYPMLHKNLAREMQINGGLLTEFKKGILPDKHNFPKRNRVVAGMADATIVIETAIKGGSMITAELASNYNRELFALPGKITDLKSEGCNQLIKENKANLFLGASDFLEWMGWQEKKSEPRKQRLLFYEMTKEELLIADLFNKQPIQSVDNLYINSGLSSSAFAAAILSLELQNAIESLPGKMYRSLM